MTNATINNANDLSDDEKAALDFFTNRPRAAKPALAAALGKSEATAGRTVKRLTEKGLLRHEGPNKGDRWITALSDTPPHSDTESPLLSPARRGRERISR